MVIATRVALEAGITWEIPFVGTLEDPLYSLGIWSDEDWASAWATGMLNPATDGELSTSRSVAAGVCSLLIRRCGNYPAEWLSCGLEPIAPNAQTVERCMRFASGARQRVRERLLSRSADLAMPSSIPLATSTSMRNIDRFKAPLASSRLAPTSTGAVDHVKTSLASSRLAPTSMGAVDRVKASLASSRLTTSSMRAIDRVKASPASSSLATQSIDC